MKYTNIQNKVYQEKIFKNLYKQKLWEYFPPILKIQKYRNKSKRKGKDKESYTFIVFTIFNINQWWIVVFFDDELSFRNKNYLFICNVKKVKKSFMECEREIGFMKKGHF